MQVRMTGGIGFIEDIVPLFTPGDQSCMRNILDLTSWQDVRPAAREILRRVRLPNSDADHMPMGRTWTQAQIDLFAGWLAEDSPKLRGEQYCSFFRELDSMTEYFDVYGRPSGDNLMPAVSRFFGSDDIPGRRKALNIWRRYAAIPDNDPTKAAARLELDQELAQSDTSNAIKRVDAVMLSLLRVKYSQAGLVNLEALLDAFLRFGADRLPEDTDRLQRIKNLNDPNDFRLTYALFHRMDSVIMWMNWMGQVECSVTLMGESDHNHSVRLGLMAALCLGYSADCVFRSRGQTRPEYYLADGEERMWRKSVLVANDFSKARIEAHELSRLRETKQPANIVAMDVPVRFRATFA